MTVSRIPDGTSPRRHFLRASLGAGAALLLPASQSAASVPMTWRERHWLGFGTTLSLRAAHADVGRLDSALDAAVAAVRDVHEQMNLFDADSALSRLNATGRLATMPSDLRSVLQLASFVAQRSGGAFDATVQPLWRVFEAAQAQGRLPSAPEVAAARAYVDWRGVMFDDRGVRLARPGMALTLNGIAQGHAADRARSVLQAHGVHHALLDTGEWVSLGRNAEGRPWVLGVADPRDEARLVARLALEGRCLATSADNLTSFSDDHRYHHIFDPHTGVSPPELASVTVVARRGALADALTKVMFVAGAQRSLRLARAWGVDVLVVDKAGRWHATPGLRLGESGGPARG